MERDEQAPGKPPERNAVQIEIVSDTICPWCFIGKRRLEKALRQLPDIHASVYWRPFQLDASIPAEGVDRQAHLARKFGAEGAKHVYDRIRTVGAEAGIEFAFEKIKRTPNTLDSHRLLHWAEEEGCQNAVAERLFELYFLEGADIGNRDVLAKAAGEGGMDEAQVRARLDTHEGRSLILREVAEAVDLGIDGVPCFIFNGSTFLPGAQSSDALAHAISGVMQEQRT
jgi:predicted DsbA family dithiol-disulfide isomerase